MTVELQKRVNVKMIKTLTAVFLMVVYSIHAQAADAGTQTEAQLTTQSSALFGIKHPLMQSVSKPISRAADNRPEDIVLLADGLKATFLTREAANHADMFAFWPDDSNPTHLIFCIEGIREKLKDGRWNPSVQRIDIQSGKVETVIRGMDRCDGIRRTPWGTILATEESPDGQAYELLDPLAASNLIVHDRQTGKVSDATQLAKRRALPTIAWEGLTVLPDGVVIAGDEWRPGTSGPGAQGGAIYKFIPDKQFAASRISALDQSPLLAGTVYALRVDCQAQAHRQFPQYGQGCEIGNAVWVKVSAGNARRDAMTARATGYYRPEDLHADPLYAGAGVRFCWTNTGNRQAANFGEVLCAVDTAPSLADKMKTTVNVQRFIDGDPQFNSFDNLAFQPVTGNLYVLEDDQHGEIYACLPDGRDRDLKSDGCIRILAVVDPSAEPTGFAFSADGRTAFLSIQHSRDDGMPLLDGYPTDDILRISGFQLPK